MKQPEPMTPAHILARFPHASKSCLAVNLRSQPIAEDAPPKTTATSPGGAVTPGGSFSITISGQCPSGKNAMKVTRSGHHYAGARFKAWRACAIEAIRNQLPKNFQMFTKPVDIRLDYFAGDRRRRDQPGIQDAIWHVLEKAGVVKDDALLWALQSSRALDKTSPRVVITFLCATQNGELCDGGERK